MGRAALNRSRAWSPLKLQLLAQSLARMGMEWTPGTLLPRQQRQPAAFLRPPWQLKWHLKLQLWVWAQKATPWKEKALKSAKSWPQDQLCDYDKWPVLSLSVFTCKWDYCP